jgi:hypothetical protein
MSLERMKMELQQAQNLVQGVQRQLELLESKQHTTPQKKGGGPFSLYQRVRVIETGHEATICGFLGGGLVLLKTYRAFKKHYTQLEAL